MEKESLKLVLSKNCEKKNLFMIEDNNNKIKGIFKIINSEKKDYLQINVNLDNFYEGKYLFDDLKCMDCFKYSTEENLDDIYFSIIEFINDSKYEINQDKYGDVFTITFRDEIRRKILKSTFKLPIKVTLENNEIISDLLIHFEGRKEIIEDINDTKEKYKILFNYIFDGSSILLPDHINLLREWFKSKFILEKIYDSDKDGKTPKDFHNKCDNINNVLVLLESNFGKLFGGFTTTCFNSGNTYGMGEYDKDFIFSLSEKTIYRKKYDTYSIYNSLNYFPNFGYSIDNNVGSSLFGGYNNYDYFDIFLDKDCFKENNGSYTYLSRCYEVQNEPNLSDNDRKKFLAGGKKFWLKKMEIFSVNLNLKNKKNN